MTPPDRISPYRVRMGSAAPASEPIDLDRAAILAFRRRVGALDQRLPRTAAALRRAAWAGLQDSVPRAALIALHARVEGIRPDDWEHPSLAQLWGPRFTVFVVARQDVPVFSLGTLPDDERGRRQAVGLADRLEELLDGEVRTYSWAGHTMGEHPNRLRYAGATGRVLIRWDGARQPTVWTVASPEVEPPDARRELARRWLHVCGPSDATAFARWAGIAPRAGRSLFESLRAELVAVRTPLGGAWILASDEAAFREARSPGAAAPSRARILSSGDPYLMAGDRELLVPDAANRRDLFPPGTVWPGGLMVDGELVGTWRRAAARLRVRPWRRLASDERIAVEAEAATLPLPGLKGEIHVTWDD
jgi:hypothetical protein